MGQISGAHRNETFDIDLCHEVTSDVSVSELIKRVESNAEIPAWAQRLFYKGKYLCANGGLLEQGVPPEGAVLLLAASGNFCGWENSSSSAAPSAAVPAQAASSPVPSASAPAPATL